MNQFYPVQIYSFLARAFGAVVGWYNSLIEATGMGEIINIAIITVLAINILIMPLRGAAISGIQDHTVNKITKKKKTYNSNAKLKSN